MIKAKLFDKPLFQQAKSVITSISEKSKALYLPPALVTVEKDEKDVEGAIPHADRQKMFEMSTDYIKHRKYYMPQFGARYGKPAAEYKFEDIFFTLGYKNDMGSCHFTRDALGKVVCYSLYIVKPGLYLEERAANKAITRGVIDAYAFMPISLELVRKHHGDHPLFDDFMKAIGHTAQL